MLSAHSPVSVRPLYGAEAFRKSRSMAGGMTGGLVLLALSVCMMTPVMKPLSPPKASPAVMLMRVVRPEPTPQPAVTPPDAMRKLLSPESEVKVPVPPVVEKPKVEPPREAREARAREAQTVRKTPPVKKKTPVARQPHKPARPAVETAKTDGPPAAVASTAASVVPAPAVAGTQERPDDKSKALATVLEVLNRYKRYPKQARRIGAEGTAQLLVTISADGKVNACSLGKGSGSSVLDAATERLGEKLVGLDVPSARGGKGLRILVPVRYSLKDA